MLCNGSSASILCEYSRSSLEGFGTLSERWNPSPAPALKTREYFGIETRAAFV